MNSSNLAFFNDCLARRLMIRTDSEDITDLDDFTSYLSSEVWPSLPRSIQEASYTTRDIVPDLDALGFDTVTLPPSFVETLTTYGLLVDHDAAIQFLKRVLDEYLKGSCAPQPVWSATRTTECELCEREVPLTYHHLIPRSTHKKVLKKNWHKEEMLNSVAWLCRPCHSVVHHVASNDELAQKYFTTELLLEREDIQKWRNYASKQRFGVRRG